MKKLTTALVAFIALFFSAMVVAPSASASGTDTAGNRWGEATAPERLEAPVQSEQQFGNRWGPNGPGTTDDFDDDWWMGCYSQPIPNLDIDEVYVEVNSYGYVYAINASYLDLSESIPEWLASWNSRGSDWFSDRLWDKYTVTPKYPNVEIVDAQMCIGKSMYEPGNPDIDTTVRWIDMTQGRRGATFGMKPYFELPNGTVVSRWPEMTRLVLDVAPKGGG